MANIFDYLNWRGDLSFKASPFNNVDALIFNCLSYCDLDGCVPGPGEGETTVYEAGLEFLKKYPLEEIEKDKSFTKFAPQILSKIYNCPRFKNCYLSNYVSKTDADSALQFAALQIETSDDCSYIAFRGTDDTVVGWKEDFYLAMMTVSSEEEAVKYLNEIQFGRFNNIRLGGHSKGGHLSIYAADFCDPKIQNRIIEIYDHDGPGFHEDFVRSDRFKKIESKIIRTIPEDSIIGRLLENDAKPIIVESSEKAIMQHDPSSWQVMGDHFVEIEKNSSLSDLFDETLTSWINNLDMDKRKTFVDELFSIFEASGEEHFTQIPNCGIKSMGKMIEALNNQSNESSEIKKQLVKIFFSNWNEMTVEATKNSKLVTLIKSKA